MKYIKANQIKSSENGDDIELQISTLECSTGVVLTQAEAEKVVDELMRLIE